jgi:uncharacterized cupredoxin-like copper-binding protein
MKTKLIPVAAIAAIVVAGCGSAVNGTSTAASTSRSAATATATGGAIKVDLSEWAIKASQDSAHVGKVTFDIHNSGTTTHEFVVLRTSKPAGDLGGGSRIPETNNVGEEADMAAGADKTLSLDLKPGHYSLVCNLPGHYTSGMHTDFTIR